MVDDGRKMEHPIDMIVESTIIPTNPSLKLKINLRDRQTIRKRHRSSSPANSSDSSSTHGSTRSSGRHQTTSAGGTRASSLKRNRREVVQRYRADESDQPSPQPDTPPPSTVVGSPNKKNGVEPEARPVEVKKVRIGSGSTLSTGSVTINEKRTKSTTAETIIQSNILLVDMNGEESPSPKTDGQFLDPSGSPPESPVGVEVPVTTEVESKLENQVETTTSKIVKQLTRDELERLVMEQMCLAIRERGITGELERKLEASDAQLDRYRRRAESLHKQVSDLELVVRKFVQQSKGRNQPLSPPIKMTRSVGLQINLNSYTNSSLQISAVKKPVDTKPAVSIAPAVTVKASSATSSNPQTASNGSTLGSPSSNNNLGRVPIPPSFTMQSPDIASYVPQQAVPRYKTAPQRRSEEGPTTSKIATYVNISGVKGIPTANNVANRLFKNAVNITPVIPGSGGQRPQGNPNPNTTAALLARARSATTGDINTSTPSAIPASIPMARWSKVPSSRATTVNKVTLPVPGRPPNVIDLTDEDLEKERAAAAANRLVIPNKPTATTKPISTQNSASQQNGLVRGVALKSTTLNGRNPLVSTKVNNNQPPSSTKPQLTHPAPLPPAPLGPVNPTWKAVAPRPTLDIKRVANGIVLSWNMQGNLSNHAEVASYQLFAYQEGSDPPTVNGSVWKRVGDVKALPLPMACTLTQFLEGHRYHFAVRAMDIHGRAGPYSEPGTIVLS